jgi:pyridoxine kinase
MSMQRQKRVAVIQDLSGFGKCSLTVALPILCAAGLEACAMPTAILSTHTGGFSGFTFRDLTEDLLPFARHWHSLQLRFDAIYCGFLGSFEQIAVVEEVLSLLKSEETLLMVDPCMADHGRYYRVYTPEMAKGMASLCGKADLIVPNMTEAAFLLGEAYREGPYTEEYIAHLLRGLTSLGCGQAVLTGIYDVPGRIGAAGLLASGEGRFTVYTDKRPGSYHGTGDVFASVLLSSLLQGNGLEDAAQCAAELTYRAVRATEESTPDERYGIRFEAILPWICKMQKANW